MDQNDDFFGKARKQRVAVDSDTTEILRRIRQADAGGPWISSEAMNAWIDSWDTDQELPQPTADITRLERLEDMEDEFFDALGRAVASYDKPLKRGCE